MSNSGQVVVVNVGQSERGAWTGRIGRTSIRKEAATGPVRVRWQGLEGDSISDLKYHGTPDNAVYAFAREDLDRWQTVLGQEIRSGQFGENLTTAGIDVNEALVGEHWRVGSALLEVAKVRTPCRVFANWMDLSGYDSAAWVRRFTEEGRPGPYLRVLEEGVVEAGDPITVEHRPDHGITVAYMFRALTTERALLPELLRIDGLAESVRAKVGRTG